MIEKAYAKLNLTLDVKNKRDDNYHEIESVMLPLEFHDTLEIGILQRNSLDDFVVCDDFSLKVSKYNLVHKMIDICRQKFNFKERLNVTIHKNIYLQGGLGGGSADAAAIFRAIIKLFKLKLTDEEIKEVCLSIGSDVYFQFYNKPAIVKGKGDILEFFDNNLNCYVLLVKPFSGNPSAKIFETSDEFKLIHGDYKDILLNLNKGNLNGIQNKIFNSLFEPAKSFSKDMEECYKKLKEFNFEGYGMTGSGTTLFALSNNLKEIKKASKYFFKNGNKTDITKFLTKNSH